MIDIRKGVVVSRTNLIDSKKETALPWRGTLVILIVAVAVWGAAFYYNYSTNKKIVLLQNNLNILKQSRDYEKIASVSDSESRLNSIDALLTARTGWESVFKKLEENTIPDVTFSSMDAKKVDNSKNGSIRPAAGTAVQDYVIDLKGTTMGLTNLSRQILAFQGNVGDKIEPFAKDVKVTKIDIKKTDTGDIDKGGAIEFTLRVDLNPNLMKTDYKASNE